MPLLTFYAVLKPGGVRGVRVPVESMDYYPSDWVEVKMILRDVMRKAYVEHKQVESTVFLETHMPGKFIYRFTRGRYSQRKVRFKRQYEAVFRVHYNSRNDSVDVVQAVFTGHLSYLASDFWAMERGRRYNVPSLIPREHQNILENPKAILMEPSATRYADYSRTPRSLYSYGDEKFPSRLSYEREPRRQYLKSSNRPI